MKIVIPKRLRIRKNGHSSLIRNYELQEDKCTDKLVIYKCVENGCLESFKRTDFIKYEEGEGK